MDFVSHHVRTKLDELKRQEVNRLRTLIKAKQDMTGDKGSTKQNCFCYCVVAYCEMSSTVSFLCFIYGRQAQRAQIRKDSFWECHSSNSPYHSLLYKPVTLACCKDKKHEKWDAFNFPQGMAMDHQALLKQFEHLNHMNPHTFEVEDLDRLIKSVGSKSDFLLVSFFAH